MYFLLVNSIFFLPMASLFHFSLLPNAKALGKIIQTMKPCAIKLDSNSWQ